MLDQAPFEHRAYGTAEPASPPLPLVEREGSRRRSQAATDVLQERIRARIVQGAGRATRNDTDFAVVVLLGSDLLPFLARGDVLDAMHPEVHAELELGFESSFQTSAATWANIDSFLH